MSSKRSYQSGDAKRKVKKQRIKCKTRGKQMIEELGWIVASSRLSKYEMPSMYTEQHEEEVTVNDQVKITVYIGYNQ